jgi:hypothetical protein
MLITSEIQYAPKFVIPAKAGIQLGGGCRIKPGMTAFEYSCRLKES